MLRQPLSEPSLASTKSVRLVPACAAIPSSVREPELFASFAVGVGNLTIRSSDGRPRDAVLLPEPLPDEPYAVAFGVGNGCLCGVASIR